jgi:hypothetical protein
MQVSCAMDMIEYVGEGGDGSKRGGGDDGVAPENEELADHLLSRYVLWCGVDSPENWISILSEFFRAHFNSSLACANDDEHVTTAWVLAAQALGLLV